MLDGLNKEGLASASEKVNGNAKSDEYKILVGGQGIEKEFYDCRASRVVKGEEITKGVNAFGHLAYNFLAGCVDRLSINVALDNWLGVNGSYECKNEKAAIKFLLQHDAATIRMAWREYQTNRETEAVLAGKTARFREPSLQTLHRAVKGFLSGETEKTVKVSFKDAVKGIIENEGLTSVKKIEAIKALF